MDPLRQPAPDSPIDWNRGRPRGARPLPSVHSVTVVRVTIRLGAFENLTPKAPPPVDIELRWRTLGRGLRDLCRQMPKLRELALRVDRGGRSEAEAGTVEPLSQYLLEALFDWNYPPEARFKLYRLRALRLRMVTTGLGVWRALWTVRNFVERADVFETRSEHIPYHVQEESQFAGFLQHLRHLSYGIDLAAVPVPETQLDFILEKCVVLEELCVILQPPSRITADAVNAVLAAVCTIHTHAVRDRHLRQLTLVLRGCPSLAGVQWEQIVDWIPRVIFELRPHPNAAAAAPPIAVDSIPAFVQNSSIEIRFVDREGRHVQRSVHQAGSEGALQADRRAPCLVDHTSPPAHG